MRQEILRIKVLGLIDVGHFKSEHIGVNFIVKNLKVLVKKQDLTLKLKDLKKKRILFIYYKKVIH